MLIGIAIALTIGWFLKSDLKYPDNRQPEDYY